MKPKVLNVYTLYTYRAHNKNKVCNLGHASFKKIKNMFSLYPIKSKNAAVDHICTDLYSYAKIEQSVIRIVDGFMEKINDQRSITIPKI